MVLKEQCKIFFCSVCHDISTFVLIFLLGEIKTNYGVVSTIKNYIYIGYPSERIMVLLTIPKREKKQQMLL